MPPPMTVVHMRGGVLLEIEHSVGGYNLGGSRLAVVVD